VPDPAQAAETDQLTGRPSAAADGPLVPAPSEGEEPSAQRLRLAEDRVAHVLSAYRQLKTETEGFKERTTRTLERRFEQRHERLLLKFIDILDNFDRALEAAEQSNTDEDMVHGLILVRSQLLQVLQQEGLERIPVLGLPFDPHVSEAVEMQSVAQPEHDHAVVKELQRGYRVKGRLVRPSRVVVGAYHAPGTPEAERTTSEEVQAALGPTEQEASEIPVEVVEGPAASSDEAAEPGGGESIEDIVSRVEAQQALFPHSFEPGGGAKE
jgi:molecular chaperone GrpE